MFGTHKPKLVVFDLDYTMWPFWVDTHVSPPFLKKNGTIVDKTGRKINCYPEVPEILEKLHENGVAIGVASRTSEIEGAGQLVELFGWLKYISYVQIYPGSKITHFSHIKKLSNIAYKHMLFFDDENRNIIDIKGMGVTSILVQNGMSMKELKRGLQEYSEQRAKSKH